MIDIKHTLYGNYSAWDRETYQRNCIQKVTEVIDVDDNDILLISDVDEIPNKDTLLKLKNNQLVIKENNKSSIYKNLAFFGLKTLIHTFSSTKKKDKYRVPLKLNYFHLTNKHSAPVNFVMNISYYYINYVKVIKPWSGIQCIKIELLKKFTPDQIRSFRSTPIRNIESGWHFSFLGGKDTIRYKIKNFSHQEFNKEEILSDKYIDFCIENGFSLFDYYNDRKNTKRTYDKKDLSFFPEELKNIITKYPKLILK